MGSSKSSRPSAKAVSAGGGAILIERKPQQQKDNPFARTAFRPSDTSSENKNGYISIDGKKVYRNVPEGYTKLERSGADGIDLYSNGKSRFSKERSLAYVQGKDFSKHRNADGSPKEALRKKMANNRKKAGMADSESKIKKAHRAYKENKISKSEYDKIMQRETERQKRFAIN